MKKGRLYDRENDCWLNSDDEPDSKANAVIVSEKTFWALYTARGFEFVEIGEDEKMKALGAPRLPGLGLD